MGGPRIRLPFLFLARSCNSRDAMTGSFRDVVVDDTFVPLARCPVRTSSRGGFLAMLALDGVCIGQLTGRVEADEVVVDRFEGPAHLGVDPDDRVYCSHAFDQRALPEARDTLKTLPLGIQAPVDTEPASFGIAEHPHDTDWVADRVKWGVSSDALLALVFPFLEALRAAYPGKEMCYDLWGWCIERCYASHALTREPHRGRLMETADVGSGDFRDAVQSSMGEGGCRIVVEATRFARVGRRAVDLLTSRMSWRFV